MYGSGEYSLDAIKEIQVTGAFNHLREDQKQCQTLEPFEDCMTKQLLGFTLNSPTRIAEWMADGTSNPQL